MTNKSYNWNVKKHENNLFFQDLLKCNLPLCSWYNDKHLQHTLYDYIWLSWTLDVHKLNSSEVNKSVLLDVLLTKQCEN